MSVAFVVLVQLATGLPDCSRLTIEEMHNSRLREIQRTAQELLKERRGLLAKRSELAKRAVELAEMSSIKREVSETFGKKYNQEDLERLDLAYTARLNTIVDEAQGVKADVDLSKTEYENNLEECGFKVPADASNQ